MNSPITIVLFEDDGKFAAMLKSVLEFQEDIKIVRRFERFEVPCLNELKQIKPSLIILDIEPPFNSPYDGIQACEKISNMPELSSTKLLILSAHIDEYRICTALINGADGYACKSDRENIVQIVRSVQDGEHVFSKSIQQQFFKIVLSLIGSEKLEDFEKTLTEKERAVWDEKRKGKSNKDIAEKMHITIDGVKFHITHYNRKLKDFKASRQSLLDKIEAFLQRKLG